MRLIFEILMVIGVIAIILIKWFPTSEPTQQLKQTQQTQTTKIQLETEANPVPSIPDVKAKKNLVKPSAKLPQNDQAAIRQIQLKFNTGDFLGALKVADALTLAEHSQEFRRWLEIQMPPLLTAAGWAELKSGKCESTVQLLLRAQAYKRTSDVSRGLAYCYKKRRNLYAAEEQLLWFLDKYPEDTNSKLLLADVLESMGDFSRAAELLQKTTGDNDETNLKVKNKLKEMKNKVKEGNKQQTLKSRFFVLRFRQNDHAHLAEFVLNTLDEALDEFVENYGFNEPKSQVEVLLYPGENFKQVVSNSPDWAEGLFDGRMKIPVRDQWLQDRDNNPKDLKRILRHELVHALFAHMSDYRAIPPWFNEGMAQRLQCESSQCSSFSFGPKPGNFLAKEDFLQPYTSYDTIKASLVYSQSLYLIYALETQEEQTTPFKSIVENITINSKLDSDSLLKHVGLDFQQLSTDAKSNWIARKQLAPKN